jgi:nucleotide-binding universal stress UspA family protein
VTVVAGSTASAPLQGPLTTILVGIDGSTDSDRAAVFATKLAVQLGADVVAAHAVGLLDVMPEPTDHGQQKDPHAHVEALMNGPWTAAIRDLGVQPRVFLLDGPPTRVLLELADQIDADLIVVGSRGAGQAEVFALGDTSTKLTHQSTRPVLVVPAVQNAENTLLTRMQQQALTDGVPS